MTDLNTNLQVKAQDRRRGHRFQPPKADLAKVPALYATEHTPTADKVVHLHYFTGACDWYITELDPETWLAFGYANRGDPQNAEWGYIDLTELGSISTNFIGVERDMFWVPKRFAQSA